MCKDGHVYLKCCGDAGGGGRNPAHVLLQASDLSLHAYRALLHLEEQSYTVYIRGKLHSLNNYVL